MKDLDVIPSPYLTGFFEKIMNDYPDVKFHATWESNRGCPFKCSFCDWGELKVGKQIHAWGAVDGNKIGRASCRERV